MIHISSSDQFWGAGITAIIYFNYCVQSEFKKVGAIKIPHLLFIREVCENM